MLSAVGFELRFAHNRDVAADGCDVNAEVLGAMFQRGAPSAHAPEGRELLLGQ